METVEAHFKERSPPSWEVTTAPKTSLIVRKNASEDLWGVIQRCALIDKDGSVQFVVHNQPISLDHLIRTDLPCRVSLTSIHDFSEYVLIVVNVLQSYEVCMGIPESQYSKLAAKDSCLVWEPDYFKE